MNKQAIIDELIFLLETNGAEIRKEPLGGGGGGLCIVKGKAIFFLDTQGSSAEIAVLAAQAVTKVVDIETIYVKPQVRQFIEDYANNST